MTTQKNQDPLLSVAQFSANCVDNVEINYALALSSRAQPIAALGAMEWDAQAGFFSLWERSRSKKSSGRKFEAEGCFAAEPGMLRATPMVGFIPKDQEEQALAAFRRLFSRWESGEDKELGYFSWGEMAIGLKFTPSGMIFAIAGSANINTVDSWSRGWREERLLDSGLTLVNAKERALESMSPFVDDDEEIEKVDFTRQATMVELTVMANVSRFLGAQSDAPDASDQRAAKLLEYEDMGANLARSPAILPAILAAKNPVLAEFASFLRCEVDARGIKDAMAAGQAAGNALANGREPVAAHRAVRI